MLMYSHIRIIPAWLYAVCNDPGIELLNQAIQTNGSLPWDRGAIVQWDHALTVPHLAATQSRVGDVSGISIQTGTPRLSFDVA